jgi:hypothetical protein
MQRNADGCHVYVWAAQHQDTVPQHTVAKTVRKQQ